MHRRALVIAARTTLVMLLVAAGVLLALGAVSLVLVEPPEVGGWLRSVFGRVFGVTAIGMAAILGAPAAVGLWAMAGATTDGAAQALPRPARLVLVGIAAVTVATTAVVCLASGSALAVLNLGLIALVALTSLGLAGAAAFSPHRGRATMAAIALLLVAAGTAWVLVRAFLSTPG